MGKKAYEVEQVERVDNLRSWSYSVASYFYIVAVPMSQKVLVVKGLLALLLVADIILLSGQFVNTPYDVVSVTPLFFWRLADYLFPLSILLAFSGILALFMMKNKVLFGLSSFTLYFIIFLAPFTIFRFPIYNDQLGFAVEVLYGIRDGVVMPYQGEYSTLGHAFFTSLAGEVLGLNLFQATRFVEMVFVFACFVVFLSLATSILKKNNAGSRSFLTAIVVMTFPAFALDPLVYSRGYFGLVASTALLLSMFKFMEKNDAKSSIIATITYIASSIFYPLQPLIVVIAMALFTMFSHVPASSGKNEHSFRRVLLKTLLFFIVWSAIQVYLGSGSWAILHEIVQKVLAQEFLTGFEYPALRYVGDAAVYINLRTAMMAVGWLMAVFIVLAFILKFLKNKDVSGVELFAFSLMVSLCFLGAFYGVTYHEPALRFYRSLAAAIPFGLAYVMDKITVRGSLRKAILALLLAITIVFLILAPVTKWGWTFVAYPTEHDVVLCNYIVSNCESSPNIVLYAPGSHYLLDFFSFKVKAMQTGFPPPKVYFPCDVDFDVSKAMKADYTATFYRMFIYPRWYGMNINAKIDEVITFASKNNLLYNNGGLWLLIEKES